MQVNGHEDGCFKFLGDETNSTWFEAMGACEKVLFIGDLSGKQQGCSPHEKQAAPPREKQALPRPAEIDKTRGPQRGKTDYRLHRLCPHIWAESGEMKEKLFIWSFVQLVIIWFAGRPFKVRECNVFLDQNTIL